MSISWIAVSGIEANGCHGANPGERDTSQRFVVDLLVTVDPGADVLEETADYGALVQAAREVVERESYELIETLADTVARTIFGYPNVTRVVATVHKPGAAEALGVDDISAEAIVE
jgi:dihydroneopterin aldolase